MTADIGEITDEQARTVNIPLTYLTPKRSYLAILYTDAANAHWKSNPMAYQIQNFLVNDRTTLKIALASGGWSCHQPEAGSRRRYEMEAI